MTHRTVQHVAHEHHSAPSPHHGFIDSLIRGFAWRSGSDVAHFFFRTAPGLVIFVVVVVLLAVGGTWLYRKVKSH